MLLIHKVDSVTLARAPIASSSLILFFSSSLTGMGTRLRLFCTHLSNTPTNLCMALLNFLLFCFVLYCFAFVQYCYLKSIQYNAMYTFVGVLDNPRFVQV